MPKPRCYRYGEQVPPKSILGCGLCGFETVSKVGFRLHAKYVHKAVVSKTVNVCAVCEKTLESKKKLDTHLESHEKRIRRLSKK